MILVYICSSIGVGAVCSVSVQPNDSAGQDLWELIKLIITLQLQPVQRGGFPNLEQRAELLSVNIKQPTRFICSRTGQ